MLLQLAVILQIRTEVNEVTNVVATWRHQIKKFTSPTCPSLLSCSSSFILTFLAMEFLPQRSSQRSYQSLCNLSTETTHNGHVKEQDFGPLTSGPTRGVQEVVLRGLQWSSGDTTTFRLRFSSRWRSQEKYTFYLHLLTTELVMSAASSSPHSCCDYYLLHAMKIYR